MDNTREIRAMMMASFPCPPLPLQEGGNSHDLVSFLVDVAARRNVVQENKTRELEQKKLTDMYFYQLENSAKINDIWNAMTSFTRFYLMTYAPNAHSVRFNDMENITPPLKQHVCSWLAAQHILKGDHLCSGKYFEHKSLEDLFICCRDILVVNHE
jgi:hypothetical protein